MLEKEQDGFVNSNSKAVHVKLQALIMIFESLVVPLSLDCHDVMSTNALQCSCRVDS